MIYNGLLAIGNLFKSICDSGHTVVLSLGHTHCWRLMITGVSDV